MSDANQPLPKNPEGFVADQLTIIEYSHSDDGRFFKCECFCGEKTIKSFSKLNSAFQGLIRVSCGCLVGKASKTHGLSQHPLYNRYRSMVNRCERDDHASYQNYALRGISVCERWKGNEGFSNFLKDMGPCPKGYTIERIDNDGDYCPENCVWADLKTQARNKRSNVRIEYQGIEYSLRDFCDKFKIKHSDVKSNHVVAGRPLSEVIEIASDPMRAFSKSTHKYVRTVVAKGRQFYVVYLNGQGKNMRDLETAIEYRDFILQEMEEVYGELSNYNPTDRQRRF